MTIHRMNPPSSKFSRSGLFKVLKLADNHIADYTVDADIDDTDETIIIKIRRIGFELNPETGDPVLGYSETKRTGLVVRISKDRLFEVLTGESYPVHYISQPEE